MVDEQRHVLRLDVRIDEVNGVQLPQLIPRVDGSVLFLDLDTRAESVSSGLGMDPDELLGRGSPLLPPALTGGPVKDLAEATVWRCSCGEAGDAFIGLRVHREHTGWDDDAVVWDDWRIHFGSDLVAPGPLRFDTRSYYDEFIRANADRWWETAPRRTARELVGVLDARPQLLGKWNSALMFCDGYVWNGQGVIQLGFRHHAGRYELALPCSMDIDAAEESRRIIERLQHSNPTTWPECSLIDKTP